MNGKTIFWLIVALATIAQTINDWSNLDNLGKIFMVMLCLGFSGLTYKEFH